MDSLAWSSYSGSDTCYAVAEPAGEYGDTQSQQCFPKGPVKIKDDVQLVFIEHLIRQFYGPSLEKKFWISDTRTGKPLQFPSHSQVKVSSKLSATCISLDMAEHNAETRNVPRQSGDLSPDGLHSCLVINSSSVVFDVCSQVDAMICYSTDQEVNGYHLLSVYDVITRSIMLCSR